MTKIPAPNLAPLIRCLGEAVVAEMQATIDREPHLNVLAGADQDVGLFWWVVVEHGVIVSFNIESCSDAKGRLAIFRTTASATRRFVEGEAARLARGASPLN